MAAVPYDLVAVFTGGAGSSMRMLRLVRLVRVARLGRVQALVARFVSRVNVNYAALALAQFAAFLVLSIHWVACIWGFVASYEQSLNEFSWIDQRAAARHTKRPRRFSRGRRPTAAKSHRSLRLERRRRRLERQKGSSCAWDGQVGRTFYDPGSDVVLGGRPDDERPVCQNYHQVMDRYLPALYFAVYTLTGTGYGDVVPVTRAEYAVCVLCMMRVRRADISLPMRRGDAAAATVDIPWSRGDAAGETGIFCGGDAAVATWIFRGVAATWP